MIVKSFVENRNSREEKSLPKGFTLIELVVVIIIIGILASIALPTYNGLVEKSRRTEAYTTLKAILESQKRYALEFSNYSDGANFEGLDVNVSSGKYFIFANLASSADPNGGGNAELIAQALRIESTKKTWIKIDEASNFTSGSDIEK